MKPFQLERFFDEHEFTAPYTLTSSDCEPLSLRELLELADDDDRAKWEDLKLGYSEIPGSPELREEISRLYDSMEPASIRVAAPEECIFLAMNCMLEPGDEIVCTYPGYQSLYEIASSIGCTVRRWEPVESLGWKFEVEALAALIGPGTKAVVVNFPHNPTGYLPSPEEFEAAVELSRSAGAYFFSDEMYRYLEFDTAARLPAACDLYEKAVSLGGMSKTFGLPGARIGWLASSDDGLLAEVQILREYTTICSSTTGELLSVIALKAKQELIGRNSARAAENLALLDEFFKAMEDSFGWVKPSAGTVGFPRARMTGGAERFCREVLADAGVLMVPSTVFGYGDRHFRVGFGRRDMPDVLERVRAFLRGT